MSDKSQDPPSAAMSLGDIYFILFRHKWLILFFSFAGIMGAILLLFVVKPPQYQSEAYLSIRYVVEAKALNPPGGDEQNTRSLNEHSDNIINTELATLHSLDLAEQVVQAVTPETILARVGGGTDTNRAASLVKNGLAVEQIPDSSVIHLVFQNPDPKLVQPVLGEIIDAYYTKHRQMHQGMGASDNFLTNETVRLRAELAKTDDELGNLKRAAGVISVGDTEKSLADRISKIHQDLSSAEVELKAHQAMLGELGEPAKSLDAKPETTNVDAAMEVPAEQLYNYRQICASLAFLEGKEQNYLTLQGFTAENVLVRQNHLQIVQAEAGKKDLEEQYPKLVALDIPVASPALGQPAGASIDSKTETEQIAGLKAKIQALNSELNLVWAEATNFGRVETTISQLEQKKQVIEANLKYFMGNVEEVRIDEALGEDKAANISVIQAPSPPGKGWSKTFKKKVAMFAGGGVFGGLALAFLIELVLDSSVKRPKDIETKLRLPLFISIPAITKNGHRHLAIIGRRLRLKDVGGNEDETVGAEESGVVVQNRQHPLHRFYEGLRDRLIVYFETRNLNHKPKLVAVTSCGKGAGVSSIATGLAASLSETGDGNVLLINISGEQGAAQQFYKGKPGCSLDEALATDKKQGALVKANLYTTAEQTDGDLLPANLPKRISTLMPKFKASEYDYIIFDMPPVSQTSVTARLSGLMDMVLLVIESEKTNQDVVKRVNQLLAESKAKVSTVLNKTRNYIPARLHQEFLDNV